MEKIGPNVVTQSAKSIAEMVEEDIELRLGKGALETSHSRTTKNQQQDSIDDLVGEVHSAIEESIRDEVGESRMSHSAKPSHHQ